jgi:hypothetical protein
MDDLWTLSQMAQRLRVTQTWLKEQAVAKKVPCLKAGQRFLFNPTAVIETLSARAAIPAHAQPKPVKPSADPSSSA